MEEMGNFEVLQWMRDTKKRHAKEDRETEAQGLNLKPRPTNLKKAFEKHERHLTRDVYPYEKNPSVHNENYDIDVVVEKLNVAFVEAVHKPILAKYRAKIRSGELSKKQAEDKMEEEQEPKIFSEMELMQLHNLAPTTHETLQLCIEQWEERFTDEEMGKILEVIAEILRPDELAAKKGEQGFAGDEPVAAKDTSANAGSDDKKGLGETAKMQEALR